MGNLLDSAAMRYATVTAVAGAGGALYAILTPWVHFGGIGVQLWEVPGWGGYVAGVVALNLGLLGALITGRRLLQRLLGAASVAGAVVSVLSAVVLLLRGHDALIIFGSVVPPISPHISMGGVVAVAAVLVSLSALVATALRRPYRPEGGSRDRNEQPARGHGRQ